MYFKDIIQINQSLRIRKPQLSEWHLALPWYQDKTVLWLSEGIQDGTYTLDQINAMYTYLSGIGDLYFIEVYDETWIPIGDVTFSESTLPIVIGVADYRGKGIAYQVMCQLIDSAKKSGIKTLKLKEIYHYNTASQRLFESLGFKKFEETEKGMRYRLDL